MPLKYKGDNIKLAKTLRANATKQENHLWYDFLRTYRPKFQRQKAIDDFIVDFYCHHAKLIIELDGSQHYTEIGIEKDVLRTEVLQRYDLTVVRFTNDQIDKNFIGVCQHIDKLVKERVDLAESG